MDLARGVLLASRYRVQKAVGRGPTGTVYRAHDLVLDQPVAIKLLHERTAAGPRGARRLRREARLSRRVAHAGICRIHEYVEDGPLRFQVRDFVSGRDLRALLRAEGPLGPERAAELAAQVAGALGAIHAAGFVHRSLTARHVLCDAAFGVRLAGLRRLRRLGAVARPGRRASGPAEYMSPEEARGQTVDARSDLYSLGILVFEMVAGEPPFRGATPVLTRLLQIHEPPPLAGPRAARIPMRLAAVLQRALAKSPGERFASAGEMADALRAAARPAMAMDAGPLPWAIPEDPLGRPLASASNGPRALASVAAAAIAGMVVAGAWLASRARPQGPEQATEAASQAPSPFVPAAIESAPAPDHPSEPSPASPEPRVTVPPAVAVTRARHAPVRPIGQGLPDSVAPAVMETMRVGEEPVTPEVAAVAAEEDAPGRLQIGVRPWAVVRIDGRTIGETPLAPLPLPPGVYTARLEHPGYQPLVRRVTIRSGETVRLQVDLGQDAVAR